MFARLREGPHLTWGAHSKEAQARLDTMDEAEAIRFLGYELDKTYSLVPLWSDKKGVRAWINGLQKCVAVSRGKPQLALRAAKRLRDNERTVSTPWSLVNTTQAIWAETQTGGNGHDWSEDELAGAAREAARELGE